MDKKLFFGIIYYSPGHEKTGYVWAQDENGKMRLWESREEALKFGRSMNIGVYEMNWWVQPIADIMVRDET